jgi:hypothetical protein
MLFKAAILSTVLSVGSEAGMSGNSNGSLAEAIQQGMSQSINQTGQQVVTGSGRSRRHLQGSDPSPNRPTARSQISPHPQ